MGVYEEKLLLFAAISTTTVASIILVGIRHAKITDGFYNFVEHHRSTITFIFGVVANTLSALQFYVLFTLFKFATRIRLRGPRSTTTVENLYLWLAIPRPGLDIGLAWPGFLIVAVLWVLSTAAGPALWQAALAPNESTAHIHNGSIEIPKFTYHTRYVWDSQFQPNPLSPEPFYIESNCQSINNEHGFVSSCPVPDLLGSLLTSASSATTLSGAVRDHSKIDNPSWFYKGRSYGVASAQGVVPLQFDGSPGGRVLTYSYAEIGYQATVSCIKNTSSAFGLYLEENTKNQGIAVWEITGQLPNSAPDYRTSYPSFAWSDNYFGNNAVLGWHAFVNAEATHRYMIGIAAAEPYANLNQTQCTVVFTPQVFNVLVNVTEQSIVVNPCSTCTNVWDIEPTGRLTDVTIWSINLLARMTHSLYVSILGNALELNVQNVLNRPGLNMTGNVTQDDAIVQAISDSFTAMIDDILVAFGSSQLAICNAFYSVPVIGTVPAVKIGESAWIFAVLGLDAFLVLLVVIEAVRTEFWNRLPEFNYTDPNTMIVANDGSILQKFQAQAGQHSGEMLEQVFRQTEIQLKYTADGENAVWKIPSIEKW